jgi:transposase-like protein
MGRGQGNEAKFFKIIPSIHPQCPWCDSWHTVHQGSMNGKKRFRCEDCKRSFYLNKNAMEVRA